MITGVLGKVLRAKISTFVPIFVSLHPKHVTQVINGTCLCKRHLRGSYTGLIPWYETDSVGDFLIIIGKYWKELEKRAVSKHLARAQQVPGKRIITA